jgi:hypothetical protein
MRPLPHYILLKTELLTRMLAISVTGFLYEPLLRNILSILQYTVVFLSGKGVL